MSEVNNINNEDVVENDTSNEKSENPLDYKVIVNMIKEMNEQYEMLKEFTENSIESTYNLKPEILTGIIPYTVEVINKMTDDEIKEFVDKYKIRQNDEVITKEDLLSIKDSSLSILSSKSEIDEIKKESADILNDYFNYLTSPVVQEKRSKRLEKMKEEANKVTDPLKKTQMLKMIDVMESAQSLSFLFKRLNQYGKDEIKSIKISFFDKKRGSYIIDKFKSKISKFGFYHNLYKYFFNIEENFLEKEYHPYNNLFLFIYMRFVAYADVYNKNDVMYVQALTSNMANLIYHKFDSTVNEQSFIEIIKKILDNFNDYYDYFKINNTTQPDHPLRIAADNKRNADRREALINKMNELKITGYDENATADELQTYLNESLDKMLKPQLKKKDETDESVDDSSDQVHESLEETNEI